MRASASYHSNQHHHHLDSDAQQQQEEILEEERERPSDFDPYAWERPLDTVNRVSACPSIQGGTESGSPVSPSLLDWVRSVTNSD